MLVEMLDKEGDEKGKPVNVGDVELQEPQTRVITLDDALDEVGVGVAQYQILLICGMLFCVDAMEINLLGFVSEEVKHDWCLTNAQTSSIASAVFAGQLVGCAIWGFAADRYGRKPCFFAAGFCMAVFGLASAAATDVNMLIAFRAGVGFGVGGVSIPFDILAELTPPALRGKFLLFIEFFWTAGALFIAGIAWAFLDTLGWRFLAVVAAVPVVLSLLLYCVVPESPRWLLVSGQIDKCVGVVEGLAAKNRTTLRPFTVDRGHHEAVAFPVATLVKDPKLRRVTVPLWVIWMGFGFCYYGIVLLVTRLFQLERAADAHTPTLSLPTEGEPCSAGKVTFDYPSIFINTTAEILGLLVSLGTVDRLGRKRSQFLYYFLGGLFAAFAVADLPHMALVALAFVARAAAMGGSCITWVMTPELYPTEARGTGHALANGVARVGAFSAPFVVESNLSVLTVGMIILVVNLLAAVASLLIPHETAGVKLDIDDIDDDHATVTTAETSRERGMSLGPQAADEGLKSRQGSVCQ